MYNGYFWFALVFVIGFFVLEVFSKLLNLSALGARVAIGVR